MKGRPWTGEEEKLLQQMLREGRSVRVIAKALDKTRDCVRIKIARLGLEVVVQGEKIERTTTTSLNLPAELPSIEEELKVLVGALKLLETPDLEKSEVLRLRGIVSGVKIYQELLANYIDYRGLETQLLELREKYALLAKKSSGDAS